MVPVALAPNQANAGYYMVMSSSQLSNLNQNELKNKKFKNDILYLQSVLKHKSTVGNPIFMQFFAPLVETNEDTAKKEIFYNFRQLGEDLTLLEEGQT